MSRLRILNVEPEGYSPLARRVLERVAEVDEAALGRAALLAAIGRYDALVARLGHRIDAELLRAGRRLRAVATATTGLDHVDLEAAAARGIAVVSLKGEAEFLAGVTATAELAWGLIVALLRRIGPAFDSVRARQWDRDRFVGRELKGKRLGLLGLGRLGRMVARYGLAFGMDVTAHDPYAADWPSDVARAADLGALLAASDVLSLHAALTPETRGMIGAAALARLPRGAWLVNTARGDLVDEAALIAALESGQLAGAAVDVLAGEGQGRALASPLVAYAAAHDNLLITPHVGGATRESMEKTEIFIAEKLVRALEAAALERRSA
jgi:D-3-phosphoglycerate dehydrogenase